MDLSIEKIVANHNLQKFARNSNATINFDDFPIIPVALNHPKKDEQIVKYTSGQHE